MKEIYVFLFPPSVSSTCRVVETGLVITIIQKSLSLRRFLVLQNHIRMSLGLSQDTGRTCPLGLHIKPYRDVCRRRPQDKVYDPGAFLSAGQRSVSQRCHDDIKVLLVQSQDPDVSLISQMDIFMYFIYNISAMSWRY